MIYVGEFTTPPWSPQRHPAEEHDHDVHLWPPFEPCGTGRECWHAHHDKPCPGDPFGEEA